MKLISLTLLLKVPYIIIQTIFELYHFAIKKILILTKTITFLSKIL